MQNTLRPNTSSARQEALDDVEDVLREVWRDRCRRQAKIDWLEIQANKAAEEK